MQQEEDNTVYVGKKDVMNYAMAIKSQFSSGYDNVYVKARGRTISRAVDAVEVAKDRFLDDVEVENIDIGTDKVTNDEGGKDNVSYISIKLGS